MEKNSFMIQMDFVHVNGQAKQLDEIAGKLFRQKNKLNQVKTKIPNAWRGENSDDYSRKMEILVDETERIANALQKIAEVVRGVAKQTYEAENEALERARNRFGGNGGGASGGGGR